LFLWYDPIPALLLYPLFRSLPRSRPDGGLSESRNGCYRSVPSKPPRLEGLRCPSPLGPPRSRASACDFLYEFAVSYPRTRVLKNPRAGALKALPTALKRGGKDATCNVRGERQEGKAIVEDLLFEREGPSPDGCRGTGRGSVPGGELWSVKARAKIIRKMRLRWGFQKSHTT